MDTPNFGAILDRPANEIQRPKPLPVGTYVCVVVGLPREDKSTKKGTEFVEFTMRPIEASTDIDEDDLKAMGGLENKTLRVTFWLVEGLTRAGRSDRKKLNEARLLFERMLGYANHLGLYAEQTSIAGEALGNYPQALTHLALISAAFNLDRTLNEVR